MVWRESSESIIHMQEGGNLNDVPFRVTRAIRHQSGSFKELGGKKFSLSKLSFNVKVKLGISGITEAD